MPRRLASVKSGAVSFDGISCSKKESTSAWSGMNQRGKNVVSVSSGNTTRSQPMRLASRNSAIMRSTTSRLEWLRWIGPICAAPTVRMRAIKPSVLLSAIFLVSSRPCALYIVGELRRGEGAALEEIADRIGRKLGLLGLGMGAVLLGLAGRAVPQPMRPRIVPPARLVVGRAVEDLEADVGMLEPDLEELHQILGRDPDRQAPHVERRRPDIADPQAGDADAVLVG